MLESTTEDGLEGREIDRNRVWFGFVVKTNKLQERKRRERGVIHENR